MFSSLIKSIGGLVGDTIEATKATSNFIVDNAVEAGEGLASIPELLVEGYNEGLMIDPTTSEDAEVTVTSAPGFKRPEAA